MSLCVPNIVILGHSFVRRLKDDLDAHFDQRAAPNFHLSESGRVYLMGTGGRTVHKIFQYDLSRILKYKPDIVILERGTNDLSTLTPEVVGSKIDDLARCVNLLTVTSPKLRHPIVILMPKLLFCVNICQWLSLTSLA